MKGSSCCLVFATLVLVASCSTLGGGKPAARWQESPSVINEPLSKDPVILPQPTWPIRATPPSPLDNRNPLALVWIRPTTPTSLPAAMTDLLPPARDLPLKETPPSRSWEKQPVSSPQATLVKPRIPTAAMKTAVKPAPLVPAKPQPAPAKAIVSEPTAAAKAQLLPQEEPNPSDYQWQDLNGLVGDKVTIQFSKTNWLYLDEPSQQKILGFRSVTRDPNTTTFEFQPGTPGKYVLEFQRQDLTNGTTVRRKVNLSVLAKGTRTSALSDSQTLRTTDKPTADALETSKQLNADGKTAEAAEVLRQVADTGNPQVTGQLARLLAQSGQTSEALNYAQQTLSTPGPEYYPALELASSLALKQNPQNNLDPLVKLWLQGKQVPPEDLYLKILQGLRENHLSSQLKEWATKYSSWYSSPEHRDLYLFQWGQYLEEPGTDRDVKGAWKAYDEIVRLFPLSSQWKLAGERASYLNRHFLQVR